MCCQSRSASCDQQLPAGLAPFTEYALRLRACNAAGCSDWCGNVVLSTSSHVPSCPRHVCAQGKPSKQCAAGIEKAPEQSQQPFLLYLSMVEKLGMPSLGMHGAALWPHCDLESHKDGTDDQAASRFSKGLGMQVQVAHFCTHAVPACACVARQVVSCACCIRRSYTMRCIMYG